MEQIKNFLKKNESKVMMAIGMILVSVLSFQVGSLKGSQWQKDPLIIEKPVQNSVGVDLSTESSQAQSSGSANFGSDKSKQGLCPFVASKNYDKYHPSENCSHATRIKEENKVCFSSEKEAESKGYVKSSCFK